MTVKSIRDIAATARGRRSTLGLSQAEVASRARVSRQWVSEFEAGKSTAEMGLVLRLLAALDLELHVEEPASSLSDRVDLDALLDEYRRA